MNTIAFGERQVGRIGLGCMGMSFAYGPGDETESLRVLNRALELGVNHWDTADMYGAGENEKLVAKALKGNRDKVFLATKFANVYDRSYTSHQDQVHKQTPWIVDGTPKYVRESVERSLARLEIDCIDLYYQHRVDPLVPVEETWGELSRLVTEGKVRYLGISEAAVDTVRRAHAVHPVAAVQSELSIWTRDYLDDVVPLCEQIGAKFVAYSPLGRGFLTGRFGSLNDFAEGDWRRSNPRFVGENFDKNKTIVDLVKQIAERLGVKPGQVALAWVLAQGDHILPIPGTKRLEYLEENTSAAEVVLSPADLQELNGAPPATGHRYPEAGQAYINL